MQGVRRALLDNCLGSVVRCQDGRGGARQRGVSCAARGHGGGHAVNTAPEPIGARMAGRGRTVLPPGTSPGRGPVSARG